MWLWQPLSRSRLGKWSGIATAVLAVALAGVSWIAYRATRPAELKPLVRLDVDLGPDVKLDTVSGADVILSPDGTRLVYVSKARLFTRKLDQPQATELLGSEGAYAPFFSPDAQWVGFFAGGKLKKLSVDGGTPVVLCDSGIGLGGSWAEDGSIVAALGALGPLSRIPANGGAPTLATELATGELLQRWPQVLPGGKAVLFTSVTASGTSIDVMTFRSHARKVLQPGGYFGRYLATGKSGGHLVYMNNGTLFAVAFDPEALEVIGVPVPMLNMVVSSPQLFFAEVDVSQNGMLAYRSGTGVSGLDTIQWLDRAGNTQPLLAKPGHYQRPRLSPDGQRLALSVAEGTNSDVWIYEWQRDTMTRRTFGGGGLTPNPVWSPDGRYIVFVEKSLRPFWTRSDGAGTPQPLTQEKTIGLPWSISPDGKRLAYMKQTASDAFDLWTIPLESDGAGLRGGKQEPFLETHFDERYPAFSPDGHWLAYASNESGTYQAYVRAFPDKGGKWQVSNVDGSYPVWSPNGRELFFAAADSHIMVAGYSVKGDSFVSDKPKVWSDKRIAGFGFIGGAGFDLAPDGKRIVALMPVDTPEAQQAQSHVTFLMNFGDELRRKVPVGK